MSQDTHMTPELSEGTVQQAEHGSNFPPFDVTTFEPQLVWLLITFGILYYLMSKIALPRIGTVIEERRDRIADDLDQAAQFKQETDDAIQAYETALAEARGKAHAIAQETRERLSAQTETKREALEAELAKKVEEAETRISSTKDAALQNVRTVAGDVAGAVITQLLGDDADAAQISQAVDAAMNQEG